jgi:hypothetical protein
LKAPLTKRPWTASASGAFVMSGPDLRKTMTESFSPVSRHIGHAVRAAIFQRSQGQCEAFNARIPSSVIMAGETTRTRRTNHRTTQEPQYYMPHARTRCPETVVVETEEILDVAYEGESIFLLGELAHIHGHAAGGPRHNPGLTPRYLNGTGNLLLLCPNHHSRVDRMTATYTVEVLYAWRDWNSYAARKSRLTTQTRRINSFAGRMDSVEEFMFFHRGTCRDKDCICQQITLPTREQLMTILHVERREGFGRDFGSRGLDGPPSNR